MIYTTEAQRWLAYAESDLNAAQTLADAVQAFPRQICFSQQAAEKARKAILVFLELEFPSPHDLDQLRVLIPKGWRVKDTYPAPAELTMRTSKTT